MEELKKTNKTSNGGSEIRNTQNDINEGDDGKGNRTTSKTDEVANEKGVSENNPISEKSKEGVKPLRISRKGEP